MKKIALAIVATLFCATTAFGQDLEKATEKYNAAIEKLQAKAYELAIPLLKEAMTLASQSGEEGIAFAKQIQETMPKVYLQLGVLAAKNNKFDEAIEDFLKAEELADLCNDNTTRRNAARFISGVYMQKGIESFNAKDFPAALDIFLKGYKQDTTNIQLMGFTSKAYAEVGQLEKALPMFEKIIETGKANSKYETNAEDAQKDLENYGAAAVSAAALAGDLEKAAQIADLMPANALTAMLVVQAANNAKKYDVVIERAPAAIALQKDAELLSEANHLLGIAYQNKGNKDKAIEYFSKVTTGQFASAAKAYVVELKK